jgi:hypothetical protein
MWRQVKLRKTVKDVPRFTYMICWLRMKKDMAVGKFVDLKSAPGLWEIMWMSQACRERPPQAGWHVGGL